MPPYPATISTDLFGYDLNSYDISEVPDISHNDGKSLMFWLSKMLGKDVAFLDPWGNEYIYEYPLEEGGPGFRLFSAGPDGKLGKIGVLMMLIRETNIIIFATEFQEDDS